MNSLLHENKSTKNLETLKNSMTKSNQAYRIRLMEIKNRIDEAKGQM